MRPSLFTTSAAELSIFPSCEVGEGVIEVKATNGDTHLGGDNLDQRIVDWLIDEFKKNEGLDLRGKGNEMALQRLRDAAERAKIELSTHDGNRNQFAVHHGGCERSEAPGREVDSCQARIDGGRHHSTLSRAMQAVHERRRC